MSFQNKNLIFIFRFLLIGSILLLTLTGCQLSKYSGQTEDKLTEKTLDIKENMQITYEDLRIGVSYIGNDPYIFESDGKTIPSAQIWPFLKEEETGRPSILVHEGDLIEIGKYQLSILNISKSVIKIKFVTLLEK